MTVAVQQRPVRIDPRALRHRKADGSYPFVQHRTCAEWTTVEAAGR